MAGSLGGRREPIETRVGQPVWFNPMLEAERIGAGTRNQAQLSPEFTHPLTHTHTHTYTHARTHAHAHTYIHTLHAHTNIYTHVEL